MRLEAKVGLFVLFSLFALFVLSVKLSTFANIGKEGYVVYAYVDNAAGLEVNGKVKINGVDAGYIYGISLDGGKPKIALFIFEKVRIAEDSRIIVKQESLLGGKFIEIVYGSSASMLAENGVIDSNTVYSSIDETANSINDAANEIKKFFQSLNKAFDDNTSSDLRAAIANFKTMGASLTRTSDEFQKTGVMLNDKLPDILAEFNAMAKKLGNAGGEFETTGKTINEKLPEAMDNLNAILRDNKEPLNRALVSADNFFSTGEDAFASIDEFVSGATESKIALEIKGNRMMNDGYTKTHFKVAYIPSLSNYYLIEVVSGADYSKVDKATGELITPGLHDEGKYFISAQMGKQYDNFTFRGGIKESSGGIGADYASDLDVLKASVDLFDFNAVNDIRGESPHATLEFRYRPLTHINFYAGADNFLNADTTNMFVGFGIDFIDDDLKYLLISAGGAVTGG